MLEVKGQVLHRVPAHLIVPGWLLSLNALVTGKSRSNEILDVKEISGCQLHNLVPSVSLRPVPLRGRGRWCFATTVSHVVRKLAVSSRLLGCALGLRQEPNLKTSRHRLKDNIM